MRKSLSVLLILVLFLSSTVDTSSADSRHHGSSYHTDHIWAGLGIGLLTGALIGTVLYQPPEERIVVYNPAPPAMVYAEPVIFDQRYLNPAPQPQLVLRRVRTTAGLLNIRSSPGVDAPVNGQAERNAILDVLGAAPEWLYIRTEMGLYGWVMEQYTREAEGPVG